MFCILKYVIDSNVFASLLVKDEYYDIVKRFFNKNSISRLITLDLSYVETANVLWKHTYLFKRLSINEYNMLKSKVTELIDKLVYKVYSSKDYLVEALDLAVEHGITLYDSLYIVLAIKNDGKLATLDKALMRKLENTSYYSLIYYLAEYKT